MEQSQGNYPPPVYRNAIEPERERSLRTLTHVLYALYAVHWLTGGLTILIAIIINYVKRPDVVGTPYEAHFEWQIRSFWMALAGLCDRRRAAVRGDRYSGSVGRQHLDVVPYYQRLAVSVR